MGRGVGCGVWAAGGAGSQLCSRWNLCARILCARIESLPEDDEKPLPPDDSEPLPQDNGLPCAALPCAGLPCAALVVCRAPVGRAPVAEKAFRLREEGNQIPNICVGAA